VRSSRSTSQKFAAPYLQASLSSRADRLGGSVGQPFDKSITWTESGKKHLLQNPKNTYAGGLNANASQRSIRISVPPSVRLFVDALQYGYSKLLWSVHETFSRSRVSPANRVVSRVEPRGFEPPTSAVQSQSTIIVYVRRCSKIPANNGILGLDLPYMFAVVRAGWCTTGVNGPQRSTERARFCTICSSYRRAAQDSNLEPGDKESVPIGSPGLAEVRNPLV
jgi:hypothetical protein